MGSMVCLCGKSYKAPLNMYTEERDPYFICLEKCLAGNKPSYEEVDAHNSNYEYKVGGQVWGK